MLSVDNKVDEVIKQPPFNDQKIMFKTEVFKKQRRDPCIINSDILGKETQFKGEILPINLVFQSQSRPTN